MSTNAAKIELADLLVRKAGLIRAARDELAKQGVVYWNGLSEILDAIERARGDGASDGAGHGKDAP